MKKAERGIVNSSHFHWALFARDVYIAKASVKLKNHVHKGKNCAKTYCQPPNPIPQVSGHLWKV